MKTIFILLTLCVGSHAGEIQITGVGLVTGLNGSGGKNKEALLRHFGRKDHLDCSICVVTANRPKRGEKLVFKVSPLDAPDNLDGGKLLPTKLLGPSRQNYAIASGIVRIKGKRRFEAFGETEKWAVNKAQPLNPTKELVLRPSTNGKCSTLSP